MNTERLIQRTCIAVFLLVCAMVAQGQTQPWDENRLTWTAPTSCTTGEPITACPITNYAVEHATSATGTFTWLANVTGTSYSHTAVTAGVHCYRIIAASPNGASAPSNVACKTNTRPVGPPNPPVLTVVAVTSANVSPVIRWPVTSLSSKTIYGLVPVGTPAGEKGGRWRGVDWCRVTITKDQGWYVGTLTDLAAPCGA